MKLDTDKIKKEFPEIKNIIVKDDSIEIEKIQNKTLHCLIKKTSRDSNLEAPYETKTNVQEGHMIEIRNKDDSGFASFTTNNDLTNTIIEVIKNYVRCEMITQQ